RTWPEQGHVPGYEGWTDNSDPVGAFDPWGNYYAVLLPYMFDYTAEGRHVFQSPAVNPGLPRMAVSVAVRPHGASSAEAWFTTHGGRPDYVAAAPLFGLPSFDKQWIAIDTNRKSKHFGRVYVSWAISGSDDEEGDGFRNGFGQEGDPQRIFVSFADARPDRSHTNLSTPRAALSFPSGDVNGSLPQVAPNGTVWLEASGSTTSNQPFSALLTSSSDGGVTWTARRRIVQHLPSSYDNTTFRSAFGETFAVGPRRVGRVYPLYLAYEDAPNGPVEARLIASFDGGRHWRRSLRVNDGRGSGEAFQPALSVAPTGTVAVSFYDRRLVCPSRGTAAAEAAGLR